MFAGVHNDAKPMMCHAVVRERGAVRGMGWEIVVSIATCQIALRHEHDDQFAGGNIFIFGSSIRNTKHGVRALLHQS